ncbi:MAG TPA: heme-binding beta-barrel domain-containing protein [Noviherbaspirillum sp.]|uniref:FABP family protein n=1 Tax=Noviherbaspirillum sp. TaxID=1926288 RepID=UPI002B47B9FB|nr:heme-binding beta-barrel domain-containing protein [Noviherbaspirillum sp.]HJV87542.1 heme-binding beta-barrel domain-containing protein [Noviherbaspirillum sp.]
MNDFPQDIYTEPSNIDVDTLANLGPLRPMAGVWRGARGLDVKPKADGPRKQAYVERMELQPIDPVTNGPQLFYGLRYYIHITKPDNVKTYHEQVGYWLWEPATGTVIHTLAIPRGQIAMAMGSVSVDAREFELVARKESENYGIRSNPFLDYAFNTVEFRIRVSIHDDGSWSYEEDTIMLIRGKDEPFHHTDRNTLVRSGEPTPNPLVR